MDQFLLGKLAQQVYRYCGLNYTANLSSLHVKISSRLQALSCTLLQYMERLDQHQDEWDVLVELLTINETYFYREDKQLAVYKKILPSLLKQAGHTPVNVWSAACSTGEEPYSLAITTLESGLSSQRTIRITGTDINKKVLQTAMAGSYKKRSLSFRRIPTDWLSTYFDDHGEEYGVNEQVKGMVQFGYRNLLADDMWTDTYDVIFCRNVLIYFDIETVQKVAMRFHQSLKPGGYLFLGHAESISTMKIGFETISTDGTFYYRKSG